MQTATVNLSPTFTGTFGSASLVDLIQMECTVQATRAVQVASEGKCGRIYFSRGQVVHAEIGELTGEAALFEMLGWTGGHVVVADGVHPAAETIDRHWQRLLNDAAPICERTATPIRPRAFSARRRR